MKDQKNMKRKTKIVATVGMPNEKEIFALVRAGMNVARLNFSHGDQKTHGEKFAMVRRAAEKLGEPVAILQDLSGPKIRIGDFSTEKITLKKGAAFTLTTEKIVGDETRAFINYAKFPEEISPGARIRLDDGKIELLAEKAKGNEILCRVIFGGEIRGRRGVNAPGTRLSLSAISEKDEKDAAFGAKLGVDFMALSFVQTADDVVRLRGLLKKYKSSARIIAKIETESALEHFDEILEAADGIMVARGDLAVEIAQEDVPVVQKRIIKKCINAGKPVITATQMLESMIESPVPTRAEVNDVANAVLDGTDAVMLSAETAVGKYPVLAVETMDRIARATENGEWYGEEVSRLVRVPHGVADAVSGAVAATAKSVGAKAIIAHSESGFTPRMVSRYKPLEPILVLTPSEVTARQMTLSFGCYPAVIKPAGDISGAILLAKKEAVKSGLLRKGETFVMVAGIPFRQKGSTNLLLVEKA